MAGRVRSARNGPSGEERGLARFISGSGDQTRNATGGRQRH